MNGGKLCDATILYQYMLTANIALNQGQNPH